MSIDLLKVEKLCKRFGGVLATNQLDLNVRQGEVQAIIGPNGAGKTTLIRLLTGELRQDSGHITFLGENIDKCSVAKRSLKGFARSFQITSLFLEFSVLQNVVMAVQAHDGHSFKFLANAKSDRRLLEPAEHYLDLVGLSSKKQRLACQLSHGEQRQLEIAMALATQPKMLLLDEPMAGMSEENSWQLVETLQSLKNNNQTILLVEHDMDAVFSLADRISVLSYGTVIATGSSAYIKSHPEVQRAYLGVQEATHA
ncbi:ABC transporter ATP-binding protein [Vibrio coralliilyticus]|uniref:ABC transporter ATP-binding protein n=1 Tax=Vibrio coralliilyticus TaxID=190893 RepID=UPI000810EFE8|nr:ABC transporter ATP-binding protein [Vibrio coralliilyticus]ANW22893.1 ABC transporter ATP-binding protein [Vibrio coralliilyticus]